MTEDVSGAMIFILDTSGSMIYNTVYNVNAKKKIDALKEVFEGKSLKLDKTSLKLDFNPTTKSSFTAFVVYRNIPSESVDSYNTICRRKADNENGWEIDLYDGKLRFTIKQRNNMIKNITQSTNTTVINKYIIAALYTGGNMKLILERNNNKEEFNAAFSYTVDNRNTVELVIGDANVSNIIYEVIIHYIALSDNEINKVRKYLSEKHGLNIRD